uniref:CSON000880 protein n=1 Tax=Culicoides sonorensis TaxID=179676 RepID=A0A336KZY8_CULSO
MAFKFIALFSFVALAAAVELNYHHQPAVLVKTVEHHAPAEYAFEYSVHDEHTGDVKSQKEVRHGDNVEGYYTLIDADGHRRVVHYTADEHNGFNAKVEREYVGGHYEAPKQVKYVVPVQKYVAAPVVTKVQAPLAKIVYGHQEAGHSHVSVNAHGSDYHY